MRDRTVTTSVIWIALAISIDRILASVRYTELVQNPIDPTTLIPQTVFASGGWQIGAGVLIFLLAGCAMGATIAIWENKAEKAEAASSKQLEKAKRDNRDARIKRLVAALDDDDLDALEHMQC